MENIESKNSFFGFCILATIIFSIVWYVTHKNDLLYRDYVILGAAVFFIVCCFIAMPVIPDEKALDKWIKVDAQYLGASSSTDRWGTDYTMMCDWVDPANGKRYVFQKYLGGKDLSIYVKDGLIPVYLSEDFSRYYIKDNFYLE